MKCARWLLSLLLLLTLAVPVRAHDVPDLTRTGTITVRMKKGETPVGGGTLTAYRAGQIAQDDGNYYFALTEEFAPSELSLEDPDAEALAAFAKEQKLTGISQAVDAQGAARFEALELGLYLIVQTVPAPGYNSVEPFMVSLPYVREGVYVYDVDAIPKVELEPQPTEPTTKPDPSLPQTGQLNWPVPVLAVAGAALLIAGIVTCRKGKKCGKH